MNMFTLFSYQLWRSLSSAVFSCTAGRSRSVTFVVRDLKMVSFILTANSISEFVDHLESDLVSVLK